MRNAVKSCYNISQSTELYSRLYSKYRPTCMSVKMVDTDENPKDKQDDKKKLSTKKKVLVGVGVGAGAVVAGVGAVIAAPFVLGAVGFTSAGVAAGSLAASMMSSVAIANGGAIAAGSVVAVLQSAGAAGLGAAATAGVAAAGATVGGAVGVGVAYNAVTGDKGSDDDAVVEKDVDEAGKPDDIATKMKITFIYEKVIFKAEYTLDTSVNELQMFVCSKCGIQKCRLLYNDHQLSPDKVLLDYLSGPERHTIIVRKEE